MSTVWPNYIKRGSNYEGLGHNLLTASFTFDTPVAGATGQFVLPCRAMLVGACISVVSSGTVGGNTDVTVDNTTQGVTDLDNNLLRIPAASATLYAYAPIASVTGTAATELVPNTGIAGDVYTVEVEAIPTGNNSAGLNVNLVFVTL